MADEFSLPQYMRDQAKKLREGDGPPASRADWEQRRKALRENIAAALGPVPAQDCALEPKVLGTLERTGYRIEKLVFQTRPNVWMTANAYVPALKEGQKVPAVLVVHGHWAGARRDPVVQARCLGLVKLGFFVLAVDAFGAGERYTKPARGTYHGSLYGATLWPVGHSLLGMQVYDNRRAVDYLLRRPEVNGKIGITGASGGGNQSMNAGALDERIQAVVPVCSVGNYQSYLHTACCVCEVLPGALRFTEEGDVLGLVAPRALLVINASKDGIQFSPAEAEKSLARAKDVFKLYGVEANVRHAVFESGHDYNKAMRETMYGWMTLHLKGEGDGKPIAEPEHAVEKPEDLACYPDPDGRPKGFLTPPLFAAEVGRELVAGIGKLVPDHPEMWEATTLQLRDSLKRQLGPLPTTRGVRLSLLGPASKAGETPAEKLQLDVEPGVTVGGRRLHKEGLKKNPPQAVEIMLGNDGPGGRLPPLVDRGYEYWRIEARGTANQFAKAGAIAGAPDHNVAEYGIWVGRPLLGQWAADAAAAVAAVRGRGESLVLLGQGPAAIVALVTAAYATDKSTVVLADPMVSFVTDAPYAAGTPMGLLAFGLLKVADVPHLAAMLAPRRLVIAGGVSPQGKKLTQAELERAFAFTTAAYKAMRVPDNLTLVADAKWNEIEL